MESAKEAESREQKRAVNPYVKAGFFKKLLFAWMFPLFYKGYKQGLVEEDIFHHLPAHDSQLLGNQLEAEWSKELKNHPGDPSLWRAFAKVFGWQMMFYGLGVLAYEMIRLTLPMTLARFLNYFEPNSTMTINEAYVYAGLISLTTLVQITFIHHAMFHSYQAGMRMRVASVALVYRKATRLSKSALAETTIGQMVNLISNDVSRFETCTVNVHNIWIGPVQLVVLLFLLRLYAGWTGLVGIVLLLCIVPFQIWMGKKTSLYRFRTALKTDERIRLMNEILSGIQVIKMYTWEKPFTKIVEIVRRLEMKEIHKNSMLKAIQISFNIFLTRVLIFSCILTYILLGNTVDARYVFGLSLFYELVRQCLSQAFALGVTQLAEAIISTRRIKQFLLLEEVEPQFTLMTPLTGGKDSKRVETTLINGALPDSSKPIGVHLRNVSSRWNNSSGDYSVDGINFDVSAGEMATVIGKVGSGKSTLLHVILKELPPLVGSVDINGTVSYASQEPWLFVGSVRQNILFGQDFDLIKYNEVIRVCALTRDFTLFPYGDRTIIGERGVSLSGGQRARINLARAIYKDADIYLLDDPLSAVDAHVSNQIYKECIDGYLKEKCVVLVTHQLQYLTDCKKIYLLNNGMVQHSGTYDDIKNSGQEFTKLLEEEIKEIEEVRKRKMTMSATAGNQEDKSLEEPTFEKESKIKGKVTWKIYKTYFMAGGSLCKILLLVFLFIFSQALASSVDYFLSVWVNFEQMKLEQNVTATINQTILDDSKYPQIQKYLFSVLTEDLCLYIYTGLIIIVSVLMVARAIYFFYCCISASINLHNNMFSKIVYAPMRFFNLNPSGRILNRFSKDMNQVDEYLPQTSSDTVQIGLMAVAFIVVVATVVPFILIPTGVILCIFYCIRTVFIATSRDIKRFEALTRSPIYSHLTASLQGLTTIRAFGAQNVVRKEFDNYQDAYSASYFMFLGAYRSFGFWLDFHMVIFVFLVTFSFLVLGTHSFGGSVGLAITQSISLAGWFSVGIRQWSEMENTMTSVERVKEYADITPELDEEVKEPPKEWPASGSVKFENVSLRYAKEEPYVLKDLNFTIQSNEKVGIVGRTGAGKSSMITALFRLAEIDGRILIDNVDSQSMPLNKLRSSISIIPQEPVLFSGTLRKNLDPFDEYNDETIWDALGEVQLKSAVSDLPHGLESKMSEGGANFSVGQRQLVCLARAIVRNNKLLVLDEATANVDPHTDGLIQTTIRKKFAGCTVLTIAHRLHTIMDSDKVLVMDAGRAVEFDHSHLLLQNQGGVFHALVQQTGSGMAANLSDIAAKTYKTQAKQPEL